MSLVIEDATLAFKPKKSLGWYSLDPYPGFLDGPDCPSAGFLSELRTVTRGVVYLTWHPALSRWMLRQIDKHGTHRDLTLLELYGKYSAPDRRLFYWLGLHDNAQMDPEEAVADAREKRAKKIAYAKSELKGELKEGRPYVLGKRSCDMGSNRPRAHACPSPEILERRKGESWGRIGPTTVIDRIA